MPETTKDISDFCLKDLILWQVQDPDFNDIGLIATSDNADTVCNLYKEFKESVEHDLYDHASEFAVYLVAHGIPASRVTLEVL